MIVVELGELKSLPDDVKHRECSVCGYFKELESFCNAEGVICRTNCRSCYEAPSEQWEDLQKNRDFKKKNPSKEVLKFWKDEEIKSVSISKEELIEALSKLPDGARIVVTQEGYYSDGKFASIFHPSEEKELGTNVFSIGHSHQSG